MRKKCLLMIAAGIVLATANAPTAVAQEVAGVEISPTTTLPITGVTEATDGNYNFKSFEVEVSAAGNDGNSVPVAYPANCNDKIIAVGALDRNGTIAEFSQTGDKLDVVAPGVDVLSTIPNNDTISWKGTSMACPHVAGLAALILERNPRLTVTQVNDIIEKNTKKVGPNSYNETRKNGTWNKSHGYGLINAEKALINTPR